MKPIFLFDSNLYNPLSITSLYGSEAMLQDMPKNSDFSNGKFFLNSAMHATNQILQ